MHTLDVSRLSKTFPGQRALDEISLAIHSDEVHCVLGQNGCGKSTLIKILSGYHVGDDGSSIRVDAETLHQGKPLESFRLGLRFVHQQNGVIGELSALENLALGAGYSTGAVRRIDWREQRVRARNLLAQVGRPDLDLDRPMSESRAVDRTAVAVARAIDTGRGDLTFLFLDEPTAALPVSEVSHLMALVDQVRSQGIGVVYVTHRLDEVFRIADRVTVLRDGRHVATTPVTELTPPQLIELIVGHAPVSAAVASRTGPGPAAPPCLEVTGLRSSLVDCVDLAVRTGEIVGVAGLDGSGREELAYALVGAVGSEVQHTVVDGTPVRRALRPKSAKKHGIALAPGNRQRGSAIRDFTIRENVTLPRLSAYRRRRGLDKKRERLDVHQWLARFGIRTSQVGDPGAALFSELSGGNQQKVVLAKWLATAPRVLLLDEPTSGVDVGAREAIYDVVRAQADRGIGVLVTSSDIHDHLAICDRVLIMDRGTVTAELTGDEITESALLDALMGKETGAHV